MTPCDRPGCPGTIGATGFCDTCFRRARSAPRSESGATGSASVVRSTTQVGSGSELLSLPVFTFPDPSSRILTNPRVPERERKCVNCGAEVGQALQGQPALSEGWCGVCGHPFSFLPSLHEGDLVADRYKVAGCFARGGLGWVYLAYDTSLNDKPVVLKGLIDVGDALLAQAELRALVMMDHPNIVRVLNFVRHPDPRRRESREYIVLEYVDGLVLNDVMEQCARGGTPLGEPLHVEHVIVCALQILTAFDYLHERGLLYCDMKPHNVIVRSGQHGERVNRIKLIDLGAVRQQGDRLSKIIGTPPYQVDRAEIDARGLTVQSDVHTLGVTLDEVYRVTVDWADQRETSPVAAGLESFRRVIGRATHKDPDRRFASAAEMSDQLTGVHREIAALRDGRPRPAPSTVFVPSARLLDAGLGSVPHLERWLRDGADPPLTGAPPAPVTAVVSLPEPLPDPNDPNAGFLAAAESDEPRRLLDKLDAHEPDSIELRFARCRALLGLGDVDWAQASVERATALLGGSAARDWRRNWHHGLIALARGDIEAARLAFEAVYDALPGEQAPKLALGYCAEAQVRPTQAERLYQAVWRRDRLAAGAAFGLARIRLAGGDRAGAVEVLGEVPKNSRYVDAAAIAIVTVYCGVLRAGPPTATDLAAAAAWLPRVYLDGGEDSGDARDRLTALVREAALGWVREHGRRLPADGGLVFGAQPDETALCGLLEQSYRALARQARDAHTHGVLLDRANAIRPMSFR